MAKSADIRKRILKQRGVELAKHTRTPTTYDDLPAPYHKTPLMRLIELKFKDRLDNLIWNGTIYAAAKRLGLDPSTISKWRKLILESKEKTFWEQFRGEGEEEHHRGSDR